MTVNDTILGGKYIPAKTTIFFNHMGVNFNESNFPNPERFDPERFLDEKGQLVTADHPMRRNVNAFGAGPRACIGETMAKARLFLLFASLLQRFWITQDENEPVEKAHPRKGSNFVILMYPGYKARFIERHA